MTKTIDRNEIKEKIESDEGVVLVEALPKKYFDAEHLPGAININHDEIEEKAALLLPDKNAFIVVYCSNTACKNSGIAANLLEVMGYKNVFKYAEGKQDWISAGLAVEAS